MTCKIDTSQIIDKGDFLEIRISLYMCAHTCSHTQVSVEWIERVIRDTNIQIAHTHAHL